MGLVCADYDRDGDTDVFVGNDVGMNFLWQNDGKGRFTEVGVPSGVGFDYSGDEHGNMGVDCGDYDNDGWLDFYVTTYQHESAVLYRNLGGGLFEDVTPKTGAGLGTPQKVTWGCGFVDFDNDGDRDLFVACGHLHDNIEQLDDTITFYQYNLLYENDGKGQFTDVTEQSGDGMAVKLSSRGALFDDLDNDGRMDVIVLNVRREPTIIRNETVNGNHWLQVQPSRSEDQSRRYRGPGQGGRRRPVANRRSTRRSRVSEPLRQSASLRPGTARSRRPHRGALDRWRHRRDRKRSRRSARDDYRGDRRGDRFTFGDEVTAAQSRRPLANP